MWNIGAAVTVTSVGRRPRGSSRALRALAMALAWVSIAPFGRPVVPDVYMIPWTSRGSTSMSSGSSLGGVDELVVGQLAVGGGAGRDPGRRRHEHAVADPHARLVERGAGDAGQRRVVGEHVDAGVGEDVADLGRLQAVVDRHDDGAELRRGEDVLHERHRVEQQHADPVAAAHAEPEQRPGQLVRAPLELLVRQLRRPLDQRHAVAVERRPTA